MLAVRYHRQLGRSFYIWGVFTPRDFAALIAGLAANLVLFESSWGMVALLGGYPAYLALFRLGRAPGYDAHFFRSLLAVRRLRPGRARFRPCFRP